MTNDKKNRTRWQWLLAPVMLAGLLWTAVGCEELTFDLGGPTTSISGPETGTPTTRDGDVLIASFNIQVFGTSKAGKPEVMDVLAKTLRRFDVVAIQEIRSKDQSVLGQLVDLVNEDGHRYEYVIGPRLGRTVSKEQYAYVYDATRIELVPDSTYTIPDRNDRLHREPFVARFRTIGAEGGAPFTFTLVNVHTDPDEVDEEVDVLDDAYRFVLRTDPSEDDVIVLGDLNADESKFGELAGIPNATWAVSGMPTNTRRTKTYDNLVFDGAATDEYTGRWGVLDLEAEFGLTRDEAIAVSDHLPVWAAFTATESPTRLAGAPAGAN